MDWSKWEQRVGIEIPWTLGGGRCSLGRDLTARAHDFLWTSQGHFQKSSSSFVSHLLWTCAPALPCLLPSTRMDGLLPAYAASQRNAFQPMQLTMSTAKKCWAFCKVISCSHLTACSAESWRWCRDRTGVQDGRQGTGRTPAMPTLVGFTCHWALSSLYSFASHWVLSRQKEDILLLVLSPPSARYSCSIPHGMALAIRQPLSKSIWRIVLVET